MRESLGAGRWGRHGAAMNYPGTIVFDLDGTLVDTAPDLTASLNHALVQLGRAPLAPETVRALVGHGARRLLERGLAQGGPADPALVDMGLPLFLDYYAANIADGSRPFAGVEEALAALRSAGCRLAVCTNKPIRLTGLLLEALGWGAMFDAVLGADSVPARKPDPGHLLATIAAAGGSADDAAFVGDSLTDALTAQAAGVPLVLVSFGYSDAPVAQMGADALIDDFAELAEALAGFKRRSSAMVQG
jgi:phosphoglycolate phosphatase